MENSREVLKLAISIGEILLKSGAEIYRVQETVERILSSYGMEDYHVYVLSNGIFATVHENQKEASSMLRFIPLGKVHLAKIAEMNQLSREICEHTCSVEEALKRVEQCKECQEERWFPKVFIAGIGCGAFSYLFGGKEIEAILAFFIGFFLRLYLQWAEKRGVSKFVVNIIGSAMVTAISSLIAVMGLSFQQDKIIIASIVQLLPGVTFTNAIRELFDGDYLCGGIHMLDALLTGSCIAAGVGTSVKIFQILGGMGIW